MATIEESNAFKSTSNNIDWSSLSKDIRKKKEWNQEDLAKKLGTHSSTVSKIERRETKPSIKTRKKYKNLLGESGFLLESYKISRRSIDIDKEPLSPERPTSSELDEDKKEVGGRFNKLSEWLRRVMKEIYASSKDKIP